MPEPETDKYRTSPGLSFGLKKPEYPIREMIYDTSDEAYMFREPNQAAFKTEPWELPDGLQTDGTQPRHWGEVPVAHEDNTKVIRHNPAADIQPTEQEKADTSRTRGIAAAHISDPARRQAFIAEQGSLESKGKLNRISQERLKTDAALEY